jgi:hypothetical protein
MSLSLSAAPQPQPLPDDFAAEQSIDAQPQKVATMLHSVTLAVKKPFGYGGGTAAALAAVRDRAGTTS